MSLRRYSFLVVLTFGLSLPLAKAAEPEKKAAPPGEKETGKAPMKELDPVEALAGVPRDLIQDLRPGSRQRMDAAAKASQIVGKNIENKPATLKFTVGSLEKFQRPDTPDITRFRVKNVREKIRVNGGSFDVYLMVVPDPSEDEKIAKLKKGDKVIFSGKISNGEITTPGTNLDLHIDLVDAKLN